MTRSIAGQADFRKTAHPAVPRSGLTLMMSRARQTLLLAALFIGAWIAPITEAAALPVQRVTPVVRAQGWGRPPAKYAGARAKLMARRAAEVVALHNLAARLDLPPGGVLRGFTWRPPTYHADGSVTIIVEWRPPRG